jgi:hypothetical protein
MNSTDVQVVTLRVRGASAGAQAVRLRLAQLLNSADLRPPGIAPASVLLVRRVDDPLPGRLAPKQRATRIDNRWEAAVRAELEARYREAARPQRGRLSGDPAAVLFADETEMLACLSLALGSRGAGQSWWARAVLRSLGGEARTGAVWQARPAAVPAILTLLAQWGEAAAVVSRVTTAEAGALLPSVAAAHEVPGIAAVFRERPAPAGTESRAGVRQEAAPWEGWLAPGTVPAGLAHAQAALLGVGLVLHTRPAAVRTAAFAAALQRWWQAAGAGGSEGRDIARAAEQPEAGVPESADSRNEQVESAFVDRPLTPFVDRSGVDTPGGVPVEDTEAQAAPHGGEDVAAASQARGGIREPQRPQLLDTAGPDGQQVKVAVTPGVREADGEPEARDPDEMFHNGVATEAGGVLYLINVMRALDIPDCFEAGWGLASQVGPWAVLELLGRGLLGAAGAGLGDDALWSVLAGLDGRELGTLPGAASVRRGSDGLPAGWDAAPDGALVDVADCPLVVGVNPALQAWLGVALPPLARRLQRALRVTPAGVAAALRVPGQVYVTRSHVDLVMGLEAISLPVRRAGLDANPGWLPTFGRVVTFHFQ